MIDSEKQNSRASIPYRTKRALQKPQLQNKQKSLLLSEVAAYEANQKRQAYLLRLSIGLA